jgi:hypothetical protein
MDGKPQKIGLNGIQIIIEIAAPSQKVKSKINQPENHMVQGSDLELRGGIHQKPILDLFL